MIACHMRDETVEQPYLLRSKADVWTKDTREALRALGDRDNLVLVGRGSSGNACTFATYLAGVKSGRHPIEFRPWLSTQDTAEAKWQDARVFAYSASGQSTDIAHSARWLKDRGAKILAVTNGAAKDSNLGQVCDAMVDVGVGDELAVPATKSFGAQLFVTAALCDFRLQPAADETAVAMELILESDVVMRLADFLENGKSAVWVARGPALAAAQDAALKLSESLGLKCQAWSAAEILHGPIGALDDTDRVVLFQDGDDPADSLDAVSTRLLARGAPHVTVTGEAAHRGDRAEALASRALAIPMPTVRWARSVVLAFLSQLVALELAGRRGINPDHPPGLAKVTLT